MQVTSTKRPQQKSIPSKFKMAEIHKTKIDKHLYTIQYEHGFTYIIIWSLVTYVSALGEH